MMECMVDRMKGRHSARTGTDERVIVTSDQTMNGVDLAYCKKDGSIVMLNGVRSPPSLGLVLTSGRNVAPYPVQLAKEMSISVYHTIDMSMWSKAPPHEVMTVKEYQVGVALAGSETVFTTGEFARLSFVDICWKAPVEVANLIMTTEPGRYQLGKLRVYARILACALLRFRMNARDQKMAVTKHEHWCEVRTLG